MSTLIEEYVLRLEVSIHDSHGVKVLKRKKYFSCEESRDILTEISMYFKMLEEFASFDKIHDKEEFVVRFEGVL